MRRLVAFLTISITGGILTYSVIQFIPLYIVDSYGVSEEAAAAMLSLVFSSGLWAGPLGGYLSDRIGSVPVVVVACLTAGPIVYLLGLASYGWSLSAVLLFLGVAQFITLPVSELYIVSKTSARARSTVLGLYFFASRGGPGVMVPILGYFIDRFGFQTSFTIVGAAILTVTVVCGILLWGSRD